MANMSRKLSRTMLASGRKNITQDDLTKVLPEALFLQYALLFN